MAENWQETGSYEAWTKEPKMTDMTEVQCPVCGYYCLGKGGLGCIDKPTLVEIEAQEKSRRSV